MSEASSRFNLRLVIPTLCILRVAKKINMMNSQWIKYDQSYMIVSSSSSCSCSLSSSLETFNIDQIKKSLINHIFIFTHLFTYLDEILSVIEWTNINSIIGSVSYIDASSVSWTNMLMFKYWSVSIYPFPNQLLAILASQLRRECLMAMDTSSSTTSIFLLFSLGLHIFRSSRELTTATKSSRLAMSTSLQPASTHSSVTCCQLY